MTILPMTLLLFPNFPSKWLFPINALCVAIFAALCLAATSPGLQRDCTTHSSHNPDLTNNVSQQCFTIAHRAFLGVEAAGLGLALLSIIVYFIALHPRFWHRRHPSSPQSSHQHHHPPHPHTYSPSSQHPLPQPHSPPAISCNSLPSYSHEHIVAMNQSNSNTSLRSTASPISSALLASAHAMQFVSIFLLAVFCAIVFRGRAAFELLFVLTPASWLLNLSSLPPTMSAFSERRSPWWHSTYIPWLALLLSFFATCILRAILAFGGMDSVCRDFSTEIGAGFWLALDLTLFLIAFVQTAFVGSALSVFRGRELSISSLVEKAAASALSGTALDMSTMTQVPTNFANDVICDVVNKILLDRGFRDKLVSQSPQCRISCGSSQQRCAGGSCEFTRNSTTAMLRTLEGVTEDRFSERSVVVLCIAFLQLKDFVRKHGIAAADLWLKKTTKEVHRVLDGHLGVHLERLSGDAIFAVFGADEISDPLNCPFLACRCALKIAEAVAKVNSECHQDCPRMGLGVVTQKCVVGLHNSNLLLCGSIFDRSLVLARLNPLLGTTVLLPASVYALVKDKLQCRPVDVIRGTLEDPHSEESTQQLFEPLGASSPSWLKSYAMGFALFCEGRWGEAATTLDAVLSIQRKHNLSRDACVERLLLVAKSAVAAAGAIPTFSPVSFSARRQQQQCQYQPAPTPYCRMMFEPPYNVFHGECLPLATTEWQGDEVGPLMTGTDLAAEADGGARLSMAWSQASRFDLPSTPLVKPPTTLTASTPKPLHPIPNGNGGSAATTLPAAATPPALSPPPRYESTLTYNPIPDEITAAAAANAENVSSSPAALLGWEQQPPTTSSSTRSPSSPGPPFSTGSLHSILATKRGSISLLPPTIIADGTGVVENDNSAQPQEPNFESLIQLTPCSPAHQQLQPNPQLLVPGATGGPLLCPSPSAITDATSEGEVGGGDVEENNPVGGGDDERKSSPTSAAAANAVPKLNTMTLAAYKAIARKEMKQQQQQPRRPSTEGPLAPTLSHPPPLGPATGTTSNTTKATTKSISALRVRRESNGTNFLQALDEMVLGTTMRSPGRTTALAACNSMLVPLTVRERGPKGVVKVCLTGGPCSGKSTSLSTITSKLSMQGVAVYTVPEAATLLINGGMAFENMTPEKAITFQTVLMKTQLHLEDSFITIAEAVGAPKNLVVCDRGIMDGKAFCSEEEWQTIVNNVGQDVIQLRDQRYDMVIHLVTAADGAEPFYTLANNAARTETPEQAKAIDHRLKTCWLGHPRTEIIDNSTGFEEKIDKVITAINELMGLSTTPNGHVHRFLVNGVNAIEFPIPTEISQMHTLFLRGSSVGNELRICKRGINAKWMYFSQKVRVPTNGGKAIHSERRITNRQYAELLIHTDTSLPAVIQTIHSFVWNNRSFELQQFHSPKSWENRAFLCVRIGDGQIVDREEFPYFIEFGDDVSDAESFSIFEIARASATSTP